MWPPSGQYWPSFRIGIVPQPVRRRLVPSAAEKRAAAPAAFKSELAQKAEQRAAESNDLSLQAGDRAPQLQAKTSTRMPARAVPARNLSELDALRIQLIRRLNAMLELWRACPSRLCRRRRTCVSSMLECASLPLPPCSPAREAAAMAQLSLGLKRRAAELAAENRDQPAPRRPRLRSGCASAGRGSGR